MDDPDPKGPQSPSGPPSPEAPAGPQSPAPSGYPPPPAPGPETPASPQAPAYGGPVPPGGWDQPAVAGRPPLPPQGALAGWWPRVWATLIDGLILAVPAVLTFLLIVGGALGLSEADEDVAVGAAILATLGWLLVMAVVVMLYAPLLMARQGPHNGQTLGKQVLGIRVVRDSGEPFTFGSAALREAAVKFLALAIAGSIIPLVPYLLNYLWPLWDDQNRALHDMIVSTHVVKA